MSRKAAGPAANHRPGIRGRVWWPWLKRGVTLLFFAAVAWLLFEQAKAIEWQEVWSTLRAYPLPSLLQGAALAALSLLLYSCFDLLGRYYTGHNLRAPTVMLVTFTSYALNLNLGSLVGGVAMRYRLYSRLGLQVGQIARVMTLSMLTNWTGYLLLAGVLFSFHTPALPPGWKIGNGGLHVLGLALLAVVAVYLLLCAFSRQRSFSVRGHTLELPSARLALLQVVMGAANWMIMGAVVFVLLQQGIAYPMVLSVLLVAAIAGVITHVPAGLGVLEAVFVALLSHQMPQHQLLAALLAYRAVYYLLPLLLAAGVFFVLEARAKRLGQNNGGGKTASSQPARA